VEEIDVRKKCAPYERIVESERRVEITYSAYMASYRSAVLPSWNKTAS